MALGEALAGVDVGQLITSDCGTTIMALEFEARRAMQDERAADAAGERAADMRSEGVRSASWRTETASSTGRRAER